MTTLHLTRRHLIQATAALAAATALHAPSTLAQTPTAGDLVTGNSTFAFTLYQALRDTTPDNLFLSPYSISLALAMTWLGAEGETADQMAATLGFSLDPADIPAAFRTLSEDLTERGNAKADKDNGIPARGLAIANALWGEQTWPFSDTFTALLADDFDAPLNLVDFLEAPEDARTDINTWVADNTNNRIENIIPEGAITAATRLVLANAIWFSGAWQSAFEPENTEDDTFTLLDGTSIETPFMAQHTSLPYAEGPNYQAVDLPYQGSRFAFTAILPNDGDFDAVESSLDAATFNDITATLASTDTRIWLPSFTFDYGTSLASVLASLGMADAFDATLADFTGMTEGTPDERLAISDVLHKAFIAVDEHGTEAAAATVVMMEATSAQPDPAEPVELRLNRPFLFAIRDTETGTLLFLGRLLTPAS